MIYQGDRIKCHQKPQRLRTKNIFIRKVMREKIGVQTFFIIGTLFYPILSAITHSRTEYTQVLISLVSISKDVK